MHYVEVLSEKYMNSIHYRVLNLEKHSFLFPGMGMHTCSGRATNATDLGVRTWVYCSPK